MARKEQLLPVLLFIYSYDKENGLPPSLREIAANFPNPFTGKPASTNTVSKWIERIKQDFGWLKISKKGKARNLVITPIGLATVRKFEEQRP